MSDLDPLPQDLRALFADERDAYPHDLAAQARVHRRLETAILFGAAGAVGGAGVAAAAAATKTGLLARLSLEAAKQAKLWIALSLAVGVVVGETHARLSAPPAPPPVAAPVASLTVVPAAAPLATTTAIATGAANEPVAIAVSSLPSSMPPAASQAPVLLPAPSASPSDLAAEQGLIDTARSALSRGRGADALRATGDHARSFPRGRLAEERETLAIQALLLLGKRSDAEARGRRFHEAYPQSLYGAAVDALLERREDAAP